MLVFFLPAAASLLPLHVLIVGVCSLINEKLELSSEYPWYHFSCAWSCIHSDVVVCGLNSTTLLIACWVDWEKLKRCKNWINCKESWRIIEQKFNETSLLHNEIAECVALSRRHKGDVWSVEENVMQTDIFTIYKVELTRVKFFFAFEKNSKFTHEKFWKFHKSVFVSVSKVTSLRFKRDLK